MPAPDFIYDLSMLLPTLGALVFTLFFGRELWEYSQEPKTEFLMSLFLALLTFACAIGTFALGWIIYPQAPSWGQWLIWPGHIITGLAYFGILLWQQAINELKNPENPDRIAMGSFILAIVCFLLCILIILLFPPI